MSPRRTISTSRAAGFSPRGDESPVGTANHVNPRRAFTLVEMVVVIAIIIIIITLVVPAGSAMWEQRKHADALNTIQGLFRTSRASALRADGVERGFFAFIDDQGVQRIVTIEQAPPPDPSNTVQQIAYQHVFRITDERSLTLPDPLRVVPRYVVEPDSTPEPQTTFSDDELANNNFGLPPGHHAQQHRNYFAVIFSTGGELIERRDVLIQDADAENVQIGDRTGLKVGDETATTLFWNLAENRIDIHPTGEPLPRLVVDPEDGSTALNFPTVDGLMIYDNTAFNEIDDSVLKREWLIRTAQPLYVSRWTGTVIRGPIGENEAP